jgi:hypothetical protein
MISNVVNCFALDFGGKIITGNTVLHQNLVVMQFECGTRILRVISRAGRPCHSPNCITTQNLVELT